MHFANIDYVVRPASGRTFPGAWTYVDGVVRGFSR
jgi:hypothetical protein